MKYFSEKKNILYWKNFTALEVNLFEMELKGVLEKSSPNSIQLKFDNSIFVNMLCNSHGEVMVDRLDGSQYLHPCWSHETKRIQKGSLTVDPQQLHSHWINLFPSAYFYTRKEQKVPSILTDIPEGLQQYLSYYVLFSTV